jgi:hypothetical protein
VVGAGAEEDKNPPAAPVLPGRAEGGRYKGNSDPSAGDGLCRAGAQHAASLQRRVVGAGGRLLLAVRRGRRRSEEVELVLRLEFLDGFEEDVAGYGQGLGADFVEGVVGGVPIRHVGGDVQVDYVDRGDFALGEGKVVVAADAG